MHKRSPTPFSLRWAPQIVAATALLLTLATAQDTALADAVAAAKKELRSNSKTRQLDAIAALETSKADATQWQELGITSAIGRMFQSEHPQVVKLAVTTLNACPDREAGMVLIAQHIDKLASSLRGARQPRWPEVRGYSAPVLPPFPPFKPTAKQKREYKKKMAEFKRKLAAKKKQEDNDRRIRERAMKDDAKLVAAAKRLSAFARYLEDVRSDTVVDALLRSFDVTLRQEASHLGSTAAVLVASERRDAIAKCITAVTDNKHVTASSTRDRNRLLARAAVDREKRSKEERIKSIVDDLKWRTPTLAMVKQVRKGLEDLGKRYGKTIELPQISKEDMRAILTKDKTAAAKIRARHNRETIAAWLKWSKELDPHLCDKLGI